MGRTPQVPLATGAFRLAAQVTAYAAALALVLQSCASSPDLTERPDVDVVGTWTPETYAGMPTSPSPRNLQQLTIAFHSDGTFRAIQSRCSRLRGSYKVSGEAFEPQLPTGEAGVDCGLKVPYHHLLFSARRVTQSGNALQFFDVEGESLLKVRSASD